MPKTLTIDASALTGGSLNWPAFLSTYFAGLSDGDLSFYGGTPDSAFGGTYYMNGSEVVARYTEGEDEAETDLAATVIIEGKEIAYDFIHNGAQYGHGITGAVDGLVFGDWVDGTTTATEGTGAAGRVSGFATSVTIDGLGLEAAPGAGNDVATNDVYAVYVAVRDGDAAALKDLISGYEVEIIGSAGDDRLRGYDFDDTLIGGRGDDMLLKSKGDDVMLGGRGADTIKGGGGADILLGGSGADVLEGGAGRDILKGGSGKDTLTGGPGNDRMTGGAGADTFVIVSNAGRDIITDLEVGTDTVDVSALGLSSMADFTVESTTAGTDLVAGTVLVRLLGVDASELSDDVFIF